MSGFVVDSRTLVAVRDTLGRLHDQLAGMHTLIWHQWGTVGGQALESELEHFCGTWHYGVSELGGQLQDLTRRLGEAAAAYERIEERITHASGGSGSANGGTASPTGSGHTGTSTHHAAAKHASSGHHTAKHSAATYHSGPSAPGGTHYSGGAGLGPAPGGSGHSGEKHTGGDKHGGGDKHPGVGSGTTVIGGGSATHNGNSGSGSGTTVIGGGGAAAGGSGREGRHHPSNGSGSGTTVIGGGPTQNGSSGGGSGTTTIDEKIHRSEERQRAELASVLKMVKD